MVSGFYIGLAIKAALIVVWESLKEDRSAALRERSHGARRTQGRARTLDGIPSPNKKIRRIEGEIL